MIASSLLRADRKDTSPLGQRHMYIGISRLYAFLRSPVFGNAVFHYALPFLETPAEVETSIRLPNNRASIENAPGPSKANDKVDSATTMTFASWNSPKYTAHPITEITASRHPAGVINPIHKVLNKPRKTKCGHPVGKAQWASAKAMQFLKTSKAKPGAPAGNIEKSRCTAPVYVVNAPPPIS